jgi:hypothetical protein
VNFVNFRRFGGASESHADKPGLEGARA